MAGLGTTPARMVGGPMSRQTGDVVAPPPEWLYFGAEGGFCYRLDTHAAPRRQGGKPVALYRYDREATREKLSMLGLPLQIVEQALADDRQALLATAQSIEGLRQRPELGGYEVDVRIEAHGDEWRIFVAGELYDTMPRGEVDDDDLDRIRAIAQEAGTEFIRHNTTPQEATA